MLANLLPSRKSHQNIGKGSSAASKTWWKSFLFFLKRVLLWPLKLSIVFKKKFWQSVFNIRAMLPLLSFFVILMLFLFDLLIQIIFKILSKIIFINKISSRIQARLDKISQKIVQRLDSSQNDIKRSLLIAIAFRNMSMKKTRSFVTVGGMAMGIGAIVFLVSIGYGLQRLVISRVARLEELKMADVTLGSSSNLILDSQAIARMKDITHVNKVMPIVSTVGKVNFGGGVGETVVHAVTSDYFASSGFNKLKGHFFETEEFAYQPRTGVVAGVSTAKEYKGVGYGDPRRKIVFNFEEGEWFRVRKEPRSDSQLLGYVKRYEGGYEGYEVWGLSYANNQNGRIGRSIAGQELGTWVKAVYPIWQKKNEQYEPMMNEYDQQDWQEGYVAQIGVIINEAESRLFKSVSTGRVLGEATASASLVQSLTDEAEDAVASLSAMVVGTDDQGIEWVEIMGEQATKSASVNIIESSIAKTSQAVVNTSFLQLLGFSNSEAVGELIGVKFVILPNLRSDLEQTANTNEIQYEIVSVIEEGNGPVMYVPFDDMSALGVDNFSQARIVVQDKKQLEEVREQVDNFGYKTSSVADTVQKIDQLFASVRVVLATFGLVALAVASLGMFNTLTVSLMERTHEVGVMKAMGMKSSEVRELFLAEAMVMGLLGGLFGVLLGWAAGQVLSLLLSIFSLVKGVGFIAISFLPASFVSVIIILSFIVGVLTGIYPARRAKKISALDALKYE